MDLTKLSNEELVEKFRGHAWREGEGFYQTEEGADVYDELMRRLTLPTDLTTIEEVREWLKGVEGITFTGNEVVGDYYFDFFVDGRKKPAASSVCLSEFQAIALANVIRRAGGAR